MPGKREVGLKRESRSGNRYRPEMRPENQEGDKGLWSEAVKECRASKTHALCTNTRPWRIVEKLNLTAMPAEGEIRQHNSMELPGKPGQEASGYKEVGCELRLRVNRGRWKQNLLERG